MKRYFPYREIKCNYPKTEQKKPKKEYSYININTVFLIAAIIFIVYLFIANLISQLNLIILIFLLLVAVLTIIIDIKELITKIWKYGNKNRTLFFILCLIIIILLYGYFNPIPKSTSNNPLNLDLSNTTDCTNLNNPGCVEIRKQLTRDSHGIAPIQKKYLPFSNINDFYNSLEGLTTLQRTNTYNSYVGKYVKWTMKVSDVTDECVILEIQSDKSWLNRAVDLYGVDRNTLMSLKINQLVTFEGMILPETDSSGKTIPYSLDIYDLNLINGEIIK